MRRATGLEGDLVNVSVQEKMMSRVINFLNILGLCNKI